MPPEHRLHVLAISATLIAYYWFMKIILSPGFHWLPQWSSFFIMFFSSYGVFRFFHWTIAFLLNKVRLLKQLFLGKYYIEGTWVGYYYGEDGKIYYVVEIIDQEVGAPLHISGHSFANNNKLYATWRSVTVSFWVDWHKLIYAYNCVILEPSKIIDGITVFSFHCINEDCFHTKKFRSQEFIKINLIKSLFCNNPSRIIGYATNTDSGKRLELYEQKLSNDVLIAENALLGAKTFHDSVVKSLNKTSVQ